MWETLAAINFNKPTTHDWGWCFHPHENGDDLEMVWIFPEI